MAQPILDHLRSPIWLNDHLALAAYCRNTNTQVYLTSNIGGELTNVDSDSVRVGEG